ncbi:hypothetical protein C8Q76DRAFT_803945 [Earliella scabrosa]|nr:hypothetical protein C8Q76DRAFT_803945 [Earliella scabrosa]
MGPPLLSIRLRDRREAAYIGLPTPHYISMKSIYEAKGELKQYDFTFDSYVSTLSYIGFAAVFDPEGTGILFLKPGQAREEGFLVQRPDNGEFDEAQRRELRIRMWIRWGWAGTSFYEIPTGYFSA